MLQDYKKALDSLEEIVSYVEKYILNFKEESEERKAYERVGEVLEEACYPLDKCVWLNKSDIHLIIDTLDEKYIEKLCEIYRKTLDPAPCLIGEIAGYTYLAAKIRLQTFDRPVVREDKF